MMFLKFSLGLRDMSDSTDYAVIAVDTLLDIFEQLSKVNAFQF
jgi:hypothetical protein